MRLWFGSGLDTDEDLRAQDQQIEARFGPVMAARRRGELEAWEDTPQGRLALILLADQFPRSVYRGTPAAFADDPEARRLCIEGIEAGHDPRLAPIERVFFYLPLEHSESLPDQERCLALFRSLEREAPAGLAEAFSGYTRFAAWHRDIIARFGRFPHRNAVLGRRDTAEEAAYLAAGAPRFGQH